MRNHHTHKKEPILSEAQWRGLFEQWKRSGLSQKNFCLEFGITYSRFVTCRGKYGAKSTPAETNTLLPVKIIKATTSPVANLVDAPIDYTFITRKGLQLKVPVTIEFGRLKELLVMLKTVSC